MTINRRTFLGLAGATGLLAWVPGARTEPSAEATAPPSGPWDRTVILVELAGGNDGLNTVIPFADAEYRRLRPGIGQDPAQVLRLSDAVGLHPALAPLMPAWTGGRLAIVQGVGYPEPNRSHFRSIEIVETGSAANQTVGEGWVSRLLASSPPAKGPIADGIVVGRGDLGPVAGGRGRAVAMSSPEAFVRGAARLEERSAPTANPALAHVLRVRGEVKTTGASLDARLHAAASAAPAPPVAFPRTPFGRDLETAARLLASGVDAPCLKVALGGFDTHANQPGVHERLLGELAEGLAALEAALVACGRFERTTIVTYSEFGRRARENGSRGTDHGTAAPHFVLGGRVKGGLLGAQPSLTELSSGDLRHVVDFRQLHATLARRWWGLPASATAHLAGHAELDLFT